MTAEDPVARQKRLRMRSWRRGTKEMDLILGPFADHRLETLPEAAVAAYDLLLLENDQDLYPWFAETAEAPPEHLEILAQLRDFHRDFPKTAKKPID